VNNVECSERPFLSKTVEYVRHIKEVEEHSTDMV
jgi:hypothetical protein